MHCRSVQGTMQAPLFSAAVQNRFTAGLCHCNHTCGDLLFIQLCSDSAAMLCSTAQGKMHSPLFSAALQNKLTAGLCHCNHTYGDLLFIQVCRDPAPMLCNTAQGKMHSPMFSRLCKTGSQQACVTAIPPMEIWLSYRCAVTQHQCTSWQNASPTVQCCSAKQAHSRQCVTALTPMKIWSSYRCAGTQHQCTAALFRGQCKPHCSVLLCNTGSQQAACHCTYIKILEHFQQILQPDVWKTGTHCLLPQCIDAAACQVICSCPATFMSSYIHVHWSAANAVFLVSKFDYRRFRTAITG